jgi:ketosteroid isomerase-like protein
MYAACKLAPAAHSPFIQPEGFHVQASSTRGAENQLHEIVRFPLSNPQEVIMSQGFTRFVLLLAMLVSACSNSTAPTTLVSVDAIRSLEEQERAAVLAQDFAALERIWNKDFIVNTPGNVIAPNRAVVLDNFRQGRAQYTSFERRIEEVRIGGDIAIVMGGETVRPTGNAPRAGETVVRRFTHVWKWDGSGWTLIARHANNVGPTQNR